MASTPSSPNTLAVPLTPNRRATTPLLDSAGGQPYAAEPKLYTKRHPSFPKRGNSSQSFFTSSTHEPHKVAPYNPNIPLSTLPSTLSDDLDDPQPLIHSRTTRWDVLLYLIKKTSAWVLGGAIMMLFGIAISQAFVLPKIHTCPASATCPASYDPNAGNSLQLLQAFMSYWLKAGVTISSVGLLKLHAYQAWFILVHQGNTVKNLDLILGAIKGNVSDAGYLMLKKNNRLLSVLVFGLLGVGAAISLVTGLSIEKEGMTQLVTFRFNGTSELPNSSLRELNNDGQLKATQKVISWALDGDKSHDGALRGTLVVPDSRRLEASNAVPGGPRITGSFECEGWRNYTTEASNSSWHIWLGSSRYIATADMSLSVAMWRVDTAMTRYLWVSNTTGLIPNATRTTDGGMNIALCTHWLGMEPEEPRTDGVDYLSPSQPLTSGCASGEKNICVADAVNNAILNWWGGLGTAFWRITCRGGVLGPIPPSTDSEKYCPMTQELWRETAVSMLDGIMQTAPRSVPAVQDLEAVVEGLDERRWWLNAVVPGATILLYIVGLVYTCVISQGDGVLRELNLEEVVRVAQIDHNVQ